MIEKETNKKDPDANLLAYLRHYCSHMLQSRFFITVLLYKWQYNFNDEGVFRKIMLMSKYDNFVLETDIREYLYLFYSIFNTCIYYEKNVFLGYLID